MSSTPVPGPAFEIPAYPYDRLGDVARLAAESGEVPVDLSIGTPCDPPAPAVVAALASSGAERGYPASIGSADLRLAASRWMQRRFAVDVDPATVAACVGTKEMVASTPWLLRLRRPERSVVLYPAVSYPTYAMGAQLAGCRAVGVPPNSGGGLDLARIDPQDAADALVLWVNSPGNPTGALDDLAAVAAWGRHHGVPVLSDECYVELTWSAKPESIVQHGVDQVLAVHSLSKRSNLAGVRAGFYTGDPVLVHELSELRKHVGMMVPGPVQAAATVAWDDDDHVAIQRSRYRRRLDRLVEALRAAGIDAAPPGGGFYLWVPVPSTWPGADGWSLARALASEAGVVTSPGDLYGEAVAAHVRIAAVAPDEQIEAVATRIASSGSRIAEAASASVAGRAVDGEH